jgi:hypothetical protein
MYLRCQIVVIIRKNRPTRRFVLIIIKPARVALPICKLAVGKSYSFDLLPAPITPYEPLNRNYRLSPAQADRNKNTKNINHIPAACGAREGAEEGTEKGAGDRNQRAGGPASRETAICA